MHIALTIAGSDSGGGAGIQADLKTFHQFGVYGTSVITAVTAQNTRGVREWEPMSSSLVAAQLTAVAEDLFPAAVKSGMIGTSGIAHAIADGLKRHRIPNYVLDPVMVATSGDRLLRPEAERAIIDELLPLAALVTPNLDEAEILAGGPVRSAEQMVAAGRALVGMGARAALVKGGHLDGDLMVDVLVTAEGAQRFTHPRLVTRSTHGTGCTLSAAITASLASGMALVPAVTRALDFVHRAIATAPGLGGGNGPLNHFADPGAPAGA